MAHRFDRGLSRRSLSPPACSRAARLRPRRHRPRRRHPASSTSRAGIKTAAASTRRSTPRSSRSTRRTSGSSTVAWTYPTGEAYLVQSAHRRRHDVRAREEPLDRRARRGHGQRDVGPSERGRGRRPRHELLGEQGRQDRRLLYVNAGFLTAHRREDRQHDRRHSATTAASTCASASTRDVTNVRPLQTEQSGPRLREPDHHVAARAAAPATSSTPGDMHAYDVRTGKLKWVFHSVPDPGEFGAETWPAAAFGRRAAACTTGANSTSTRARHRLHPVRHRALRLLRRQPPRATTSSATSLVALDARTGKRLWHFQTSTTICGTTTCRTAPKLLTVQHDGRDVDVVAQADQARLRVRLRPRHRHAALADRGAARAAERRAGRADLADAAVPDRAAAVRAAVVHRERHQSVSSRRTTGEAARAAARRSRNEGLFTPPSLQGTIEMPGHNGGANWGSSAVDPQQRAPLRRLEGAAGLRQAARARVA